MDVVVGGGRYGVEAARYLRERNRDFIVIDVSEDCTAVKELSLKVVPSLDEVDYGGEFFLKGDVSILPDLVRNLRIEYIFPTAPIHVAAEAVRRKYGFEPWYEVVDCIAAGLPTRVVISSGRGSLVVSYNRDHECLEKCPAPDICPVTKIRKPCPMHELVRYAWPDAFVLVSHQLKPGLGGIEGRDFINVLREAEKRRNIVIATACRCHGVITALKR
ncbi:hypothetical protein [Archaeoglobus neptunius]|uniref:hypothetical protein n=1 Tax=Archaeoglobus neptunius TaxID=2798580 RepID=UPI0019278AAF|nr:hypothetical protein [Archaeoglobus neptunius]